jgi:hypothetical protein
MVSTDVDGRAEETSIPGSPVRDESSDGLPPAQ